MNLELKIRNIVLVGAFDTLGFDKYFFIKNEIVRDEQITDKSVFLPQLVQLVTPTVHVVINPAQFVINAINTEDKSDEIAQMLWKTLNSAKNYMLSGSGINFNWFVGDGSEEGHAQFSRKLCFNPNNAIQKNFFDEKDATFGFYSSKNVSNCRLKLDVKPIRYKTNDMVDEKSVLQFEFNFHRDYREPEADKKNLEEILKDYNKYRAESERIMSTIK